MKRPSALTSVIALRRSSERYAPTGLRHAAWAGCACMAPGPLHPSGRTLPHTPEQNPCEIDQRERSAACCLLSSRDRVLAAAHVHGVAPLWRSVSMGIAHAASRMKRINAGRFSQRGQTSPGMVGGLHSGRPVSVPPACFQGTKAGERPPRKRDVALPLQRHCDEQAVSHKNRRTAHHPRCPRASVGSAYT
jgi:hypothetical protein